MTRRGPSPEGKRNAMPSPALPVLSFGLARPTVEEHSWSHAPANRTATLDRFEAAVAFAIREAARLQHEPESGRVIGIGTSER